MTRFRVLFVLAVAVTLVVWPAGPRAATGCDAEAFVNTAGLAMIRAARQKSATALAGVASRYGDLHSLAMFALGPHRKKLLKSREGEYVSLTRAFIGRFLAKYSGRFSATSLSVASCTGEAKTPTVTAKLSSGQKMVFRLYKTRKGYMVRDVNVSSVWLGQQMKSTFAGVLNRNGGNMDALFAYLKR